MAHDPPRAVPSPVLRHPLNRVGWLRLIELAMLFVPRRAACILADAIATGVWAAAPGLRRTLVRNAAVVLGLPPGTPACRALGRRTLCNYGAMLVDYVLLARSPRRALRSLMPEPPEDGALRRALAAGHGAILVSAHLGHWELGAAFLSALGHRLCVVSASDPDDPVERHRVAVRARAGVRTVHMARDPRESLDLLPVLRALRDGEAVAVLGDRAGPEAAVSVPFLGRAAALPAGPALLACLTGAPLLPAVVLRRTDGTYCGEIREPIAPDPDRPRDEEVPRLTAAVARAFEAWIRAHPDQWSNLTGHGT